MTCGSLLVLFSPLNIKPLTPGVCPKQLKGSQYTRMTATESQLASEWEFVLSAKTPPVKLCIPS